MPANEWCIYKLQARWWKSPQEFEAEDWVQDAFRSGIELAYIPVFGSADDESFDTLDALKKWQRTNYTISAEFKMLSSLSRMQRLVEHMDAIADRNSTGSVSFATHGNL